MTNLLLAFSIFLSACSSSGMNNTTAKIVPGVDSGSVLIVYLSRTSNTKTIAEIIHQNVGGTLVAIELEKPYPEDYRQTVQQVVHENETGFLPPLKTKVDSIEKYDVVFVGFPTWGMKLPPPVKSFLHQYNLSGKTVVPFNTNDGYGIGSSFETVKELCPNSKVLEGFSRKGGVEQDGQPRLSKEERRRDAETAIKEWLQKLGVVNSINKNP
jgi:flavodoxin